MKKSVIVLTLGLGSLVGAIGASIFLLLYPPIYEVSSEVTTAKYGSVLIPMSQTVYASIPRGVVGLEVYSPNQLTEKLSRNDFDDGTISKDCGTNFPPKNLNIQANSVGLIMKLRGTDKGKLENCLKSIGDRIKTMSDPIVNAQIELMKFELRAIDRMVESSNICREYQEKMRKALSNTSLPNLITIGHLQQTCATDSDLEELSKIQKKQMESPITTYASYTLKVDNGGSPVFPIPFRAYIGGIMLGLLVAVVGLLLFDILNKRSK